MPYVSLLERDQRTYLLPPADQIVNPKQPFCPYPYKKLCGAAVAWKVVCELYRLLGILEEAGEYLEFVGFATVGDADGSRWREPDSGKGRIKTAA